MNFKEHETVTILAETFVYLNDCARTIESGGSMYLCFSDKQHYVYPKDELINKLFNNHQQEISRLENEITKLNRQIETLKSL
jgi:UDP-N-acetylglucosamine transferase subunit ALG13